MCEGIYIGCIGSEWGGIGCKGVYLRCIGRRGGLYRVRRGVYRV